MLFDKLVYTGLTKTAVTRGSGERKRAYRRLVLGMKRYCKFLRGVKAVKFVM